jgi:hypothetical protein
MAGIIDMLIPSVPIIRIIPIIGMPPGPGIEPPGIPGAGAAVAAGGVVFG